MDPKVAYEVKELFSPTGGAINTIGVAENFSVRRSGCKVQVISERSGTPVRDLGSGPRSRSGKVQVRAIMISISESKRDDVRSNGSRRGFGGFRTGRSHGPRSVGVRDWDGGTRFGTRMLSSNPAARITLNMDQAQLCREDPTAAIQQSSAMIWYITLCPMRDSSRWLDMIGR